MVCSLLAKDRPRNRQTPIHEAHRKHCTRIGRSDRQVRDSSDRWKLEDPTWTEGQDVKDYYGIKKYIPPVRPTAGDVEKQHALFPSYTDVENLRNFVDVLQEGEPVYVTEKLHGTNSRIGVIAGEATEGKFMDSDQFFPLCASYGVETVPLLFQGPYRLDTIAALAEGTTTLAGEHVREGVVVKPARERRDSSVGRVGLKYMLARISLGPDFRRARAPCRADLDFGRQSLSAEDGASALQVMRVPADAAGSPGLFRASKNFQHLLTVQHCGVTIEY